MFNSHFKYDKLRFELKNIEPLNLIRQEYKS